MNTRHRAYPNDRLVMRPHEKFEAKAAGQKGSQAWFCHVENAFWPTTQASGFAAGRNREGYLDMLFMQNKPKVKEVKINVSFFMTSKYDKLDIWLFRQNKAKQSQLEPKQTQLLQGAKLIQSVYLQKIMKNNVDMGYDKQSQNKPNSNPMSKPLLGAKPLQAQSAKMAQKLTLPNHQNNTHKKYNFLSIKMLNGLSQYNPPTGTSFAYLRPEKMKLLRKEYKYV